MLDLQNFSTGHYQPTFIKSFFISFFNNNNNSKNIATVSLDTSDFLKLKRRIYAKESAKILSRNHSNEKTLK